MTLVMTLREVIREVASSFTASYQKVISLDSGLKLDQSSETHLNQTHNGT